MVAEVVLPVVVTLPGERVSVHEPDGSPFSTTEPVDTVQVGCVIVPAVGAEGPEGIVLITTLPDAAEVQPAAFLTVNVYVVPAVRLLMVTDVVLPVVVTLPGILVTVHDPDGKLLNTTEPVVTVQVGCVIVPIAGLEGAAGTALTTTFAEAADVQPAAFLTVNV
jgi:hypothetical protein